MRAFHSLGPLCFLVVGAVTPGTAQELDRALLVISRNDVEIGREEFTLERITGGRFRLASQVLYPPRRTEIAIRPVLEFDRDSLPTSGQMTIPARGQEVFFDIGGRRATIRIRAENRERAREMPAGTRPFVADDSVFAFYALLPGHAPGPVRVIRPRQLGQAEFVLADRGTQVPPWRPDGPPLRLMTMESGDDLRRIWYDANGRLVRVEVPALGMLAVRSPRRR